MIYLESSLIPFTFAAVHLNRLMKKGGGIGPVKPWQPIYVIKKGAKSHSDKPLGRDKFMLKHPSLHSQLMKFYEGDTIYT